jgi:hypothetical protein
MKTRDLTLVLRGVTATFLVFIAIARFVDSCEASEPAPAYEGTEGWKTSSGAVTLGDATRSWANTYTDRLTMQATTIGATQSSALAINTQRAEGPVLTIENNGAAVFTFNADGSVLARGAPLLTQDALERRLSIGFAWMIAFAMLFGVAGALAAGICSAWLTTRYRRKTEAWLKAQAEVGPATYRKAGGA